MNTQQKTQQWLRSHRNDFYVKLSKKEGYRSRAIYKLLQMIKIDGLVRPYDTVVDLGSAPGSWSQLLSNLVNCDESDVDFTPVPAADVAEAASAEAAETTDIAETADSVFAEKETSARPAHPKGKVIAIDRLPMQPIAGVQFIHGDFTQPDCLEAVAAALEGKKVDAVFSDMAPNLTGNRIVDQTQSLYLCQKALEFALAHLRPKGSCFIKSFQGDGLDDFAKLLAKHFRRIAIKKPLASHANSREIYLLAIGYIP